MKRHALLCVLCLSVPFSATGQGLIPRLFGVGGRHDAAQRERDFRVVKGWKLGRHLADTYPGKRVLVLLPPESIPMDFFDDEEEETELPHVATLEGLLKGLGRMPVVGKIEPKMPIPMKARMLKAMRDGDGGDMMMLAEPSSWFGVVELNAELAAYTGKYDILVSFASLPGTEPLPIPGKLFVPFTEITAFKDKGVTIAIAEGGIAKLGPLIQSGKVCAAVAYRRDIKEDDYEKHPGKDIDEAFAIRFILLTPENVGKYPAYFRR